MAIRTNYIKCATAYVFAQLDNDILEILGGTPYYEITPRAQFLALNESTLFGADSSNAVLKSSAYNTLRVEYKELLAKEAYSNHSLNRYISNFSFYDPQFASVVNAYLSKYGPGTPTVIRNLGERYYELIESALPVYLPCQYDDVTKQAKLNYNIKNKNPVYTAI